MYSNNYQLLSKGKVFCPICEKEHVVELRCAEVITSAQGKKISFCREYYICDKQTEEIEFETAKMMAENLQRVRSAYRKSIIKKEE